MAARALIGIAIVAVLLAGCDPQPPRPETGSTAARVESTTPAAAGTEGSIRLFGQGIARHRQIRV